jgi:lipopolysaccharide export system permease protein
MTFILFRYISKQFFLNIAVAYGVVLAIAGLIDLVELVRRTSERANVPFLLVLEMAALHLPHLAEKLLPYAVMIGTMMTLMKMTRSSELVVVRASGISAWRFLSPALVLAFVLGVASLMILNPLASATLDRFNRLEERHITEKGQLLSLSASGLWLRQVDTATTDVEGLNVRSYMLQARHISQSTMQLTDVIIFLQDASDRFIGRIDAQRAILRKGAWVLRKATLSSPTRAPIYRSYLSLPTSLSIRQIQDSFADPDTLSFWQLGAFVSTLEQSGFSALRHKLHWYALLMTPIVFCAMVLVAAIFSLRQTRRGRMVVMVFGAVTAGFVLNFLTGLFQAFGYAGSMSLHIAVIAPHLLAVMISMVVLLHYEDG